MPEEKETLPHQHSSRQKKRSSRLRFYILFFIAVIAFINWGHSITNYFRSDHQSDPTDNFDKERWFRQLGYERCPPPPFEGTLRPPPPRMRLRMTPEPTVYCYPRTGGVLVLKNVGPVDLEWLGFDPLLTEDVAMPNAINPWGEGTTQGDGNSSSARGEEMGGREEEGEEEAIVRGQEVLAAADQDEEDPFCDRLRLFLPTWYPREVDALAPRWWEHPSLLSFSCYFSKCSPDGNCGVGYNGGWYPDYDEEEEEEWIYEDDDDDDYFRRGPPPRAKTIGFSTKHADGNETSSETGSEMVVWVYWEDVFKDSCIVHWEDRQARGRHVWERGICAWRIRAAQSMEERCRIVEECGGERFEMEEWKEKAEELMKRMEKGRRFRGTEYSFPFD
ncbi:hypothetical protein DBV05_g2496 [Lasiodiplodia theobromae]|uniref:Uncharacterized protein n=1 Tax=Lasiodiplodia theobromae TaxID=45133 RepID=A0A5N5DMW3_9PEZI|nr:hypothetical protein DBV05_g2496 [Lasiodiplodia theobromae]